MAYIRYKEVTKHFNFKKSVNIKDLPQYAIDYVYENETLIAGYHVGRDYGIFTDKKIVLFDNSISIQPRKEITTIPYRSISAHSIIFRSNSAEIYLLLDSGYPLLLKFVNMNDKDKLFLRLIFNTISAIICGGSPSKKTIERIINKEMEFKKIDGSESNE